MKFSSIVLEVFVLTAGLYNFSFGVHGKVAQDDKNIGEHPSSTSVGLRMKSSMMTSRHHLAVKPVFERNLHLSSLRGIRDGSFVRNLHPSSLRGIRDGSQNALKKKSSIGRETLRGLGEEMTEGYQGFLAQARSTTVTAKTASQNPLLLRDLADPFNPEVCPDGSNKNGFQRNYRSRSDSMNAGDEEKIAAVMAALPEGATAEQIEAAILSTEPGSAPYFAAFSECKNWLAKFGIIDVENAFRTGPNGAVFWSTREDQVAGQQNKNMVAAQAWASLHQKQTLEMTLGGDYLNSLGMFDHDYDAGPLVLTPNSLITKMREARFQGSQPAGIILKDKALAAFTMNCASYHFAASVDPASTVIHSFFENASIKTPFNPRNDQHNHNPTFFNMEMPTLLTKFGKDLGKDLKAVFHYTTSPYPACDVNNSNRVFWCPTEVDEPDVATQEENYGIPLYHTMQYFLNAPTLWRLPDYNDGNCATTIGI